MLRTLRSSLTSDDQPSVVLGTAVDMAAQITSLLEAPPGSSLVIDVSGCEDAFVQFVVGPDAIQFDHPLITANQIQRDEALRSVLLGAGLTPYEPHGET